jgi:signal transduction histidine kinase
MDAIQIETRLEAAQDAVWATSDRLRQVLLNLVLNAADAIAAAPVPVQGLVRISTTNADRSGGDDRARAPCIVAAVEDNGPGIGPGQMANIFDPFFTTKEPGQGTGLGLAVCYMIVNALGGGIEAVNRLEGGTRIEVTLPLYRGEP